MIIFRLLLVLTGIFLLYIIGKPFVNTLQDRFVGGSAEGIVIGFRGKGASKAILMDGDGAYKQKKKARRPVFRYPRSEGSIDSVTVFSTSTSFFTFLNFELGEKVTVVYPKNKVESGHIWSTTLLATDMVLVLFSFFMIYLAFKKSF